MPDEFCMAGGELGGCGFLEFPGEIKKRQSITSDACATRTLLCGSGIEMSTTRYLRIPRTETVYARVKLEEMRTIVDSDDGLSMAKRNMSADERFESTK